MTNMKNRSQKEAATMKTDDLANRIAAARLSLNTALLTGEPTADARAALKKLQDEQDAVVAAQESQEAARQALAQIESQRISELAQTMLEARNNRIAAISTRFPSHA